MCKVDQIGVSSHFPTQQVQGFYTITVLHPGICADLSAKFSLDRGLKLLPIAYSLFPLPTTKLIQQTLFCILNRLIETIVDQVGRDAERITELEQEIEALKRIIWELSSHG